MPESAILTDRHVDVVCFWTLLPKMAKIEFHPRMKDDESTKTRHGQMWDHPFVLTCYDVLYRCLAFVSPLCMRHSIQQQTIHTKDQGFFI